ncbi:hypothetical protein K469DRAFT_149654 [Zopfia rhizophila CBS 207.26]|uniref:Uncharacterized protein n=1 Tax=Zopfia rhizophila CBS 207.26 TaxID=1314779 RepID=A0A6A6E772_9PEZI|nr:hypothetical protein K469DRAFT_149654 [Zopfia rhizophila CBS 207.26]
MELESIFRMFRLSCLWNSVLHKSRFDLYSAFKFVEAGFSLQDMVGIHIGDARRCGCAEGTSLLPISWKVSGRDRLALSAPAFNLFVFAFLIYHMSPHLSSLCCICDDVRAFLFLCLLFLSFCVSSFGSHGMPAQVRVPFHLEKYPRQTVTGSILDPGIHHGRLHL